MLTVGDSTFPVLPDRRRIRGMVGGGEGGSIGAIETRPAISETRCWEDRLRGRGRVGERGGSERLTSDVFDQKGREGCKHSSGEYDWGCKGEAETGESVNCDEEWVVGSKTRVCDSGGGVVTTEIGGDRAGGFIDKPAGKSCTDNCFA